jgi:Zn-dependent M28 family amino/carboxypeptidase
MRPIESRNVIGIVPGETDDAVAYTAHWDHLGRGVPVNGDDIYNGAVDNATGCAVVLETARVWASLDKKPRRSALFLFVTAEESGLRGSEYYGQHPLLATGNIALNINYDALYPVGRSKDVIVLGAERTTAWPLVQEAAERYQLTIQPDPHPEQGSYYRSDHFSLARVGIPAFSVKMPGDEYFREYNAKHYHQPSDEYRDDWNFTGMEHIARFGFLLGLNAANSEQMFSWNPGDEFLSAREQSFSSHTSGAK